MTTFYRIYLSLISILLLWDVTFSVFDCFFLNIINSDIILCTSRRVLIENVWFFAYIFYVLFTHSNVCPFLKLCCYVFRKWFISGKNVSLFAHNYIIKIWCLLSLLFFKSFKIFFESVFVQLMFRYRRSFSFLLQKLKDWWDN